MSNALFPTLPGLGLAWDVKKRPQFSTLAQRAVSGREVRAALWAYPLHLWTLTFNYLPQATDYATLIGFFNQRQGDFDSFIYVDPTDNAAVAQGLGAGNGSSVDFPIFRAQGGFNQPVENAVVTQVKINGVIQSGATYSVTSIGGGFNNNLHFTGAPANGLAITATFTYGWRVKFAQSMLEFNNFVNLLWEARTVELQQVKT